MALRLTPRKDSEFFVLDRNGAPPARRLLRGARAYRIGRTFLMLDGGNGRCCRVLKRRRMEKNVWLIQPLAAPV